MSKWYILDNNHKPVHKPVLESAKWMEDNPNRKTVGYDELKDYNGDDVRVSTVFLGLDHCWNGGKPILWETMIFGGVMIKHIKRDIVLMKMLLKDIKTQLIL